MIYHTIPIYWLILQWLKSVCREHVPCMASLQYTLDFLKVRSVGNTDSGTYTKQQVRYQINLLSESYPAEIVPV